MKTAPCRICSATWHTKSYHKPKQYKPMNKVGRVGKETAKAVTAWKKTQKPTHEGYYTCYICKRQIDYLTAEHMNSKARRPDQRTDPSNFAPTCGPCNEKKKSLNYNSEGHQI